jgi:hypothetical protein
MTPPIPAFYAVAVNLPLPKKMENSCVPEEPVGMICSFVFNLRLLESIPECETFFKSKRARIPDKIMLDTQLQTGLKLFTGHYC